MQDALIKAVNAVARPAPDELGGHERLESHLDLKLLVISEQFTENYMAVHSGQRVVETAFLDSGPSALY